MYVFLLFMLFINVFLLSKVFVLFLEILLDNVVLPVMNWTNKLHQNMYRLELRKVMIQNINEVHQIETNQDTHSNEEIESDEESETNEESNDTDDSKSNDINDFKSNKTEDTELNNNDSDSSPKIETSLKEQTYFIDEKLD